MTADHATERPFWRPGPGRCLNIAHRGARSLAPENTLASAAKGFELGADFWELDVGRTADGELVIIHDDNLARTSNAAEVFPDRSPWPVHHFTLAELERLDFGSWFVKTDPFGTIARGEISPAELDSFAGLAMPSLAQALEFSKAHHWPVNVEIKNLTGQPGHQTIAQEVVGLINDLGLIDQVLLSSFNWNYLLQISRMGRRPALGVLASVGQADPVRLVRDLSAQTYHPAVRAADAAQLARLKAEGVPTLIYTVNQPEAMADWIRSGASGLFTDFPQILKDLV